MRPIKRGRSWLLGALGVLFLGLIGCALNPQPKTHSAIARPMRHYPADVRAGARLYVEFACIHCHGPNGRGGVKDPTLGTMIPSLVGLTSKDDTPVIISFMKSESMGSFFIAPSNGQENGWINMPNWSGIISPAQMQDLAAYIEAGLPNLGVKPLPAKTGPEIYRSFACIKCHGQLGKGGIVDGVYPPTSDDHFVPTLGPVQYAQRSKKKGPDIYKRKLLHGSIPHHGIPTGYPGTLFMPAWGHVLTPEQLNTILHYLETGH